MGYDISYHPISEQEIQQWYFDVLKDNSVIDQLAANHGIDDFYKKKYKDTITAGIKAKSSDHFDNTHGLYIAVVQGFFRIYYYTRGSAFSFLSDKAPLFKRYTKEWQDMVSHNIGNPIKNRITDNYSSGVYIPAEQVKQLLHDYTTDENIRQELDVHYSHGRISVFLKALEYAKEHNLGILEATEVMTPQPFDLNKSVCYSNLFNCDKEGPFLYRDAALEQIRETERQNDLPEGAISNNVSYVRTSPGEAEEKVKKGFWKRLLGK